MCNSIPGGKTAAMGSSSAADDGLHRSYGFCLCAFSAKIMTTITTNFLGMKTPSCVVFDLPPCDEMGLRRTISLTLSHDPGGACRRRRRRRRGDLLGPRKIVHVFLFISCASLASIQRYLFLTVRRRSQTALPQRSSPMFFVYAA